jgi:hypothetical protein
MKKRISVKASNPPIIGESRKTITMPNIKERDTKNKLKIP